MKPGTLFKSAKLWVPVWVGVLLACQGQSLFFGEVAPVLPARTILETSMPISEAWRASSLLAFSIMPGGSPQLLLKSDRIVTINYQKGGGFGSNLVSFFTRNGEIEWETFYGDTASSLTADQNRVYVASSGRQVEAYDLQTGKLLWSGMDLPDRKGYNLDVRDGRLFNYQKTPGSNEEIIYVYDTSTGKTLQHYTQVTESDSTWVMWLGQFALYQTLDELYKINRETKEFVWHDPIENDPGYNGSRHFGIKQFPILSDNRLIVVSGRIDLSIYALNYMTGKRLWTAKGPFTSNAAVSQGKVYALRQDARLVILDEETGIELGFAQFSPVETSGTTYWVGADNQGQVYVYFSDSQELIALKIN